MFEAHSISDDLLNIIQTELRQQNKWIAYNSASFHLEKEDIYLFKDKSEAFQFASNNYSDKDSFKILHLNSISEIAEKLIYGRALNIRDYFKDVGDRLKNLEGEDLIDGHTEHLEKQKSFNTKNKNTMNQKNFEYLRNQVKFTGFGEGLENELKERMQKQAPQFIMLHQGNFAKDEIISTLHFKKSDQSDMYFFNKYDLTLKQENKPEIMSQTFYLNKDRNITLKEAYNLMSGRAVNKDLTNKEGQVYNAWVQMDFKQADNNGNYKLKQFHQNYGYDLNNALGKHPIKELGNEQDKARLLESLHKGNRQSVTFLQNGNEMKHFIEANPQFKSINIYDNNMQRLGSRQARDEKQAQVESNTVKNSTKKEGQKADKADPDVPQQANKRGRKKSQSIA